ncbi:trichohyalin [Latimeria chalumnae]|uniref:trichohyalin n=1 Tax=Latimeria chalumnae TaxID=7897 RepID=UPI0003C0FC2F|nr:PREDICTED: trichohyalin-like [Latimeria chalumnae]|eukprot:XP_005993277.1 PREDICTED: trichohyalin-like [Latimeria chalumnae]
MEPVVQVQNSNGGSAISTRKRQVRFSARHDIMLLREVIIQNPFASKESSRIWAKVGEYLTAALQDEGFEVDGRRCRERTVLLLDYYKRQDFAGLRRFGTEALYVEKEELLHEVLELEAEKHLMLAADIRFKEQHEETTTEVRRKISEEYTRQPPPPAHEPEEQGNPETQAPTAKRACQCCCQTYSEILIFLEKRAEAERRLREEELAVRKEELELQREKIALERDRLEAERKEREKHFELESQERHVILDILKSKILKE